MDTVIIRLPTFSGLFRNKFKQIELYFSKSDVNLYKYLGCFSNSFFVDLKHSDKFDDCESSCGETKLYGLTSVNNNIH